MIPNKPIRIDKSFNFSEVIVEENSAIPYIKIKGYASKMFDASGEYVIDADNENISTNGIDLKRLQTGNLPILFAHNQSQPVGKITNAEYKHDGLLIEATIYKLEKDELTNYVYEAVKAGILNSFSVGILVKEFDIIDQDGEDYLQLAKSELIETSLVSVPSNPEATFSILEVKSVGTKGAEDYIPTSYKTIINKSALKAENPEACSEFAQCAIDTKGLTYEETSKETWVKTQNFYQAIEVLQTTITDNWYSKQYWDELSSEEALLNVKSTVNSFITDFEKLILDGDSADKNLKGNEMATKDVGETTKTEEVDETKETTETVTEEAKGTNNPEEKVETVEEKVETTKKEEVPEAKEEAPAEVVPEVRTLDDLIEEASGTTSKIDSMEVEELEKLYNSLTEVTDAIQDFVAGQIKEELEEATTAA